MPRKKASKNNSQVEQKNKKSVIPLVLEPKPFAIIRQMMENNVTSHIYEIDNIVKLRYSDVILIKKYAEEKQNPTAIHNWILVSTYVKQVRRNFVTDELNDDLAISAVFNKQHFCENTKCIHLFNTGRPIHSNNQDCPYYCNICELYRDYTETCKKCCYICKTADHNLQQCPIVCKNVKCPISDIHILEACPNAIRCKFCNSAYHATSDCKVPCHKIRKMEYDQKTNKLVNRPVTSTNPVSTNPVSTKPVSTKPVSTQVSVPKSTKQILVPRAKKRQLQQLNKSNNRKHQAKPIEFSGTNINCHNSFEALNSS
jgi:hypothetical protein